MGTNLAAALTSQKDLYMNLLMAQLQNQDPMEPMSNSEMVTQMAQLATVDGITSLSNNFSEVLELHRLASGAGLIGREVAYVGAGETERGTVESMSVDEGTITLQLSTGYEIGLNEVTSVSQAQEN